MRFAWLAGLLPTCATAAPAFVQKSANLGRTLRGTASYSVASGSSKIVTDAGAVYLTVHPTRRSSRAS
jgi:hypothetical protein